MTNNSSVFYNSSSSFTSSPSCQTEVEIWLDYPNSKLLEAAKVLDGYEVLQILLMCAVILISVVGNIGVMVVFSLTPTIRSTLNCYLVNLAVADLFITTLCWPTIVNRITSPLYVLGHFLCRLHVLVQGTCVNVSVLTLGAVACNRAYAVLFPFQAHSANPRLVPLLLLLWGLSFTLAFPGFLIRDTIVYKVLCTMFFLPGFLMMAGYSVIVVRLWCMRKVPSSLSQQDTSSQQSHYHTTAASPPAPHTRVRRQSRQWMESSLFWAYFLGYTNSALNPLLYWGFSDNFRGGLSTLLTRLRSRAHLTASARGLPSSTSTLLSRISHQQTSLSLSRKSSGRTSDKEHDSSHKPLNSAQKAANSTMEV
ncbi:hypothetical protein Pcinc_029590 [Petrolisthes cinctipes]|uniref:G-protein coupled receptors family 1 profile domain-containing protein n=1 Tax=Petrolisthes cinctipes TaxID=88211 RepID=A0AAE1K7K5_PETCI|nr:hypothetical protein Pcinc_029590 [Petrolisthes cinctipes]